MNNLNLNLDSQTLEACLKEVSNLGSTRFINICNGQENIIPWGSADWILAIFLIASVGALALALLGMAWRVIFD